MKLSTKVRYSTRAMFDLAAHHGNGPVLLKDIAQRQEISLKYLERIFSSLKTAGLVKAYRGSKGGYALSQPPSQVKVSSIVEAVEGPFELVECVGSKTACRRVNSCVMHDVWNELGKTMAGVLSAATLEDLLTRDKKKNKVSGKMYYI